MQVATMDKEGLKTYDIPEKIMDVVQRQAERKAKKELAALPDEQLSPARLRLRKTAKTNKERIEAVEIKGEKWFIRALHFAELTKIGLLSSRDESGMLDLLNPESMASFMAAAMYVACAEDEFDGGNYFASLMEAREWTESSDETICEIVGELFSHIRRINPSILPIEEGKSKENPQELHDAEKKSESDKSDVMESEASTMPPMEPESSGSTPKEFTDEPASSPGDSES